MTDMTEHQDVVEHGSSEKNSALVSWKLTRGKYFYHLPAYMAGCPLEYIFFVEKNKHRKKSKKQKKLKRKKEKQETP